MRIAITLLWMVAASLLPGARAAAAEPAAKKLIEWGWDEPDTKFIRANVQRMEELPFDGLVFHAVSSKGGNLEWLMWGRRRFELAEFQHAIDDLKATPFHRLTERFLRVNAAPGDVDWFDDQAWAIVAGNFKVASQLAKQGGCRGFMFDVEQYKTQLFNFRHQAQQKTRSFAEYQAKVRQRGREWMTAVRGEFPEMTLLLSFGYSMAQAPDGAKDRSAVSYGLLADFLDGMLDACPPQMKIVDGWEGAYGYRKRAEFREAYETIKVKSAGWTAVPDKYRRQVQAGFGIWMDCDWSKVGWHTDEFSKNYFSPAAFQKSVRSALSTSDEYVWIYTEQPLWWTRERLPNAYIDALRAAKSK